MSSGADPKTTFLDLFDPIDLTPDFLEDPQLPSAGNRGQGQSGALRAPPFRGVTDASMLTGHIHIGPDLDYIERAFDHVKHEVSDAPWLDITAVRARCRARARGRARHVRTHTTLRTARGTDWSSMRQMLLTRVIKTLEDHAPGPVPPSCATSSSRPRCTATTVSRAAHLPRRAGRRSAVRHATAARNGSV